MQSLSTRKGCLFIFSIKNIENKNKFHWQICQNATNTKHELIPISIISENQCNCGKIPCIHMCWKMDPTRLFQATFAFISENLAGEHPYVIFILSVLPHRPFWIPPPGRAPSPPAPLAMVRKPWDVFGNSLGAFPTPPVSQIMNLVSIRVNLITIFPRWCFVARVWLLPWKVSRFLPPRRLDRIHK